MLVVVGLLWLRLWMWLRLLVVQCGRLLLGLRLLHLLGRMDLSSGRSLHLHVL